MQTLEQLRAALETFLTRDRTIKVFDCALLCVLQQFRELRLSAVQCAVTLGVEPFQVRNAVKRLRSIGLLDPSNQPTAAAVQLLDDAIGKPAPVVKADKRKAPAADPGDSRRSSAMYHADHLATPARAATILGMSKAKFAECELLKDFPPQIRNDSDNRMTYFYNVGELRNWARAHFNLPY
jgi:hypothetical protein